jgi:hypothetical protein
LRNIPPALRWTRWEKLGTSLKHRQKEIEEVLQYYPEFWTEGQIRRFADDHRPCQPADRWAVIRPPCKPTDSNTMTWFDQDGQPAAVDFTHPVDILEPEEAPPDRGVAHTLTLTERIADTFVTGNPEITRIAWRVLLNQEEDSIRACARRAGCTAAAISRRAKILAETFGLPLRRPQIRALRRWLAHESWKTRRRQDTRPTAACDEDRLEENNLHSKKGGRP